MDMNAHIFLLTWWRGRLVGKDHEGNRYYEDRRTPASGKTRRWVLYQGIAEASKVPSEWHGWLHYRTDCPPLHDLDKKSWEHDHEPNLTGTVLAYKPPSPSTSRDYTPWKPSK